MIGYICKYTPVELLTALGAQPVRIEPTVARFDSAEACMHPNMCSFAKAVLEEMTTADYEGIVLTTCCDAIRRLYDTLKALYPDKFIYLLDLPHKTSEASAELYARSICGLVTAYADYAGAQLERPCLIELLASQQRAAATVNELRLEEGTLNVGLIGARYNEGIARVLEQNGATVAFDLTCAGRARQVPSAFLDHADTLTDDELIEAYAHGLLEQLPCMRMSDAGERGAFIEQAAPRVDGIIYHTVKFCDSYSYEYAHMKKTCTTPLLKIETDALQQSVGQMRTRVEAFLESLEAARQKPLERQAPQERSGPMRVIGIDSGSTSTNAVILDPDRNIVAFEVIRTGARSTVSAKRAVEAVLERASLTRDEVDLVVSTGYGRVSVDFADIDVTEISCHGKGARFFNPAVHTVLDIGGQDSKAIRLDDTGEVVDFAMNDKCAAGTGRFLEAMARTLEVGIDELGPLSLQSTKRVEISSMCTVFAESEVISLIARDVDKTDIARGVHDAIAAKAFGLMRRVGLEPGYMMTGGVAKNPGVVKAVEDKLGSSLYICEQPEIVGAVGAALFGLENLERRS